MVKRNIEVEIFGQRYSIKSEFSEEQVKQVAAYVDGKMQEVAENTKSVDSLHIAILTALNIAQQYLQEKVNKEELLQRIQDKADRLEEFITLKMG
ncbi:MAG: cell division protein ZapA [Deltaproteobacteria bacterium]|jgi:cell division protein ZapA|nr:cell division protein ZapA [Deltaproteobacteria bacterium]